MKLQVKHRTHVITHQVVPFRRQQRQFRAWQWFRKWFEFSPEPQIRETIAASGNRQWLVYDPKTDQKWKFASEQAVLEWLEERHHFSDSVQWS